MSNNDHKDTQYKPTEIPKVLTRKMYIGYGIGKYNAGKIVVSDYEHTTSEFATVRLLEKELTIRLPRCKVDVKGRMLEVLEEEKQKVIADNHMRLKEVQDRIDQLKVLEYKPESEEA